MNVIIVEKNIPTVLLWMSINGQKNRNPSGPLPKILGLTASPGQEGDNKKQYEELQFLLDSEIHTVPSEELEKYVPRPEEEFILVHQPEVHPSSILSHIKNSFPRLEDGSYLKKRIGNVEFILQQLGPWCADLIWKLELDEFRCMRMSSGHIREMSPNPVEQEQRANLIRMLFEIEEKGSFRYLQKEPDPTQRVPRVKKLLEILAACGRDPSFRGIIFVPRTETARVLYSLLKQCSGLPGIKPEILCGHGKKHSAVGMTANQQNTIVKNFGAGGFNLLISTNVGEEGLDIQACNVVIMLESPGPKLFKSYIQSRGRARSRGSKYIMFCDDENTLKMFQEKEEDLHRICNEGMGDVEITKVETEVFTLRSGARVTYSISIGLLAKVFRSRNLKYSQFEDKEGLTFYTVQFLGDIAIQMNIPTCQGKSWGKKKTAKKAAAFQGCKELYKYGLFDDHLERCILELNEEEESDESEEDSEEATKNFEQKIPNIWLKSNIRDPCKLFAYSLTITCPQVKTPIHRPMCLFTQSQLPSIPSINLFFGGSTTTCSIKPLKDVVTFDIEKIIQLKNFTLRLFSTLFLKKYEFVNDIITFLVAPIRSDIKEFDTPMEKLLDWTAIKGDDPESFSFIDDRVVFDDQRRPHFVVPKSLKMCNNGIDPTDPTRVLNPNESTYVKCVEAHKAPKIRNFLNPTKNTQDPVTKPIALFCPDGTYFRYSDIRSSIYQTGVLLPSIFKKIDSCLLAYELKQQNCLPIDNNQLLIEALIAPSVQMEDNYERLETLGDSFLKILATVRVFIEFPQCAEGSLHRKRRKDICNATLTALAKEKEVYLYLTSKQFRKQSWAVGNLFSKVGAEEEKPRIGKKTLADIIEALMGAAYLPSNFNAALSTAKCLGIPVTVSRWEDFSRQYILGQQGKQRSPISETFQFFIPQIEEICGYRFQNKSLIQEAMTSPGWEDGNTGYQRLEFLGDAVLDFLVMEYLFNKYPKASPYELTIMKSYCVNNNILGLITISHGLYQFIRSPEPLDPQEVQNTLETLDPSQSLYWKNLGIRKTYGDLFESLVGAVFVDRGFQFDQPVHSIFEKMLKHLIDSYISPEICRNSMQPKKETS